MAAQCCAASATGPGYQSPKHAFQFGPREKLLYVTCTRHESKNPDFLATVDVDPSSPSFCKVIHRLKVPYVGDEVHHSGWNACSSCFGDPLARRSCLVLPGLHSSRIYLVDVGSNEREPKIEKIIEPSKMHALGVSAPHTVHCLADGNIMISTMGDENGNAKGSFVLVDGQSFEVKGKWTDDFDTPFGYDYWYQPRLDVMISSEWGFPNSIKHGLSIEDVENGKYGHALHVWNWSNRKHLKRIDLGADASMPLEVRFLHEPTSCHGFVGCGLGSNLHHFYRKEDREWYVEKVYQAPAENVQGWALPKLPAIITDILISMDDKFLYASYWLQGAIVQFDISDPFSPKLISEIHFGGVAWKGSGVTIVDENGKPKEQHERKSVKGKEIRGGPQMLQLSLDGKRLYVTTSLYSVWDQQFYPDMIKQGGVMVQVDIDAEKGGMTLNENFLVDFGDEPDGPALAHEMRYPGGDCTSDIWI